MQKIIHLKILELASLMDLKFFSVQAWGIDTA